MSWRGMFGHWRAAARETHARRLTAGYGVGRMVRMDDILNSKQAAELLKCHPKTVKGWAQSGFVPASRLGREWRFSRAQLLEWLRGRAESEQAERRGA